MNNYQFLFLLTFSSKFIFNTAQFTGSSCYTYLQESGQCVNIRKCRTIWKIIIEAPRPLPDRITEYIRNSQCGNPQDQSICCRPQDIEGNERPIVTKRPLSNTNQENRDLSSITMHRNLNMLDMENCGHGNVDKISNGNKTILFEYPWSALLGYENSLGDVDYKCGGSLITDRFVLTAAHCIIESRTLRLTTVRLGEYDTSTTIDCVVDEYERNCAPPVQEIPVANTITHPGYDKSLYLNDIALVKLQHRADTSDSAVKTICLPITPQLFQRNPEKYVVTGWGNTERGNKSNKLLKAIVSAYPNDRCQDSLSRLSKRVQITESHFCAGGEGNNVDTCSGDSGGPIQVLSNANNDVRMVQYGIVSFGPSACGSSGLYPGVYTDVRYFLKWILDNMS